jgi:hypothetical protein
MTPSGIEPANFWLVAKQNKPAIIFPSSTQFSLINHTFAIKHSELLALSFCNTPISKPLCKLVTTAAVTLHKQSVPVDT